ncbi:beta-lactamase family protein [Solitalea sp. MAHUQ-68]|uniref:Beta-lactamase family protein n=1 Tax=Solitalea agri TaxID=2953739 RepID=A0A9X2F3Z4_9SPHI|nr:serine hydrolase domain-containing protein [Solitalea agri]MCO4291931.1 beta-lactamase family protein [Solitalea agri]
MRGTIYQTILFVALGGLAACTSNSSKPDKKSVNAPPCYETLDVDQREIPEIREKIHADKKAWQLDTIFQKKVKREGFNGDVLVAQRGVVIYRKKFGYASFDRKMQDTLKFDSKFQLASMSKTFTAMAVLKLYEAGKIKLDDSVQKFIPDFPYHGINIQMLLSHRSGLPYYAYAFDDSVRKVRTPPDNNQILKWFAQSRPKPYNRPNRSFAYNNSNYMVLASIVERVSGLPFDQFLKKNIFDPIGMKNTYLSTTKNDSINMNRTMGYEGRRKIQTDYYDFVIGDKGVYSTIDDLFKWYKALNSDCFLSKKTMKEAWQPRSFERKGLKNYGYGFRMMLKDAESKKARYVYHNGWWKGYSTLFWFNPHEDYVVIILGNRKNGTVYKVKSILQVMEEDANAGEMDDELTD